VPPVPIHEAVTGVLTHAGEVLILRRQPHLLAFPGYHAFPGGKVDRADRADPTPLSGLEHIPPADARALVREITEEIGVDLAELGRRDLLGQVRSLGVIVTPVSAPIRFSATYFSIEVNEKPPLQPEAGEIAELQWATPAALLERFERGDMLAVPPTIWTLRALAKDMACARIEDFEGVDPAAELAWLEAVAGVKTLAVRSNTLPPADRTNCFLIGDDPSDRLLVDPSPNSREELERLCGSIADTGFGQIFLTHHHPDHNEGAEEISRRFKRPLGMSEYTRAQLGKRLDGVQVRLFREGDVVTHWLGHPVRIVEVPGHDEGQLALMPDNRAWCIVSDLYQGIGTVVIAAPEGNMRKYFDSLRKIIALDPRVIYPSHGLPSGTTHRLRETLKHRIMREEQVKSLVLAGKSEDEMLAAIYKDLIDPRLLPFARMNIRSHLQKLREEKVIA
jgi:glyoxylase-like metal-dependent hydrolase (beta-lactamase superfamily II)/8-oxo-dGTP pyrophosphatase MutT (NUDIX family)